MIKVNHPILGEIAFTFYIENNLNNYSHYYASDPLRMISKQIDKIQDQISDYKIKASVLNTLEGEGISINSKQYKGIVFEITPRGAYAYVPRGQELTDKARTWLRENFADWMLTEAQKIKQDLFKQSQEEFWAKAQTEMMEYKENLSKGISKMESIINSIN